jgi:hypothetical protein
MDTPQSNERSSAEPAAVIIALQSRRFVIIRPDETEKLSSADAADKPISDLQPGDQVLYAGRQDTVRSVCAY